MEIKNITCGGRHPIQMSKHTGTRYTRKALANVTPFVLARSIDNISRKNQHYQYSRRTASHAYDETLKAHNTQHTRT